MVMSHGPRKIDSHRHVPLLDRLLGDRRFEHDARVVDQHAERSTDLGRRATPPRPPTSRRVRPSAGAHRDRRGYGDRRRSHRTVGRETVGDRPADPLRPARDDGCDSSRSERHLRRVPPIEAEVGPMDVAGRVGAEEEARSATSDGSGIRPSGIDARLRSKTSSAWCPRDARRRASGCRRNPGRSR